MQQYTQGHPLVVVCVAVPEDMALLGQWERHLRPLEQAGLISFWSELHLAPGADRAQAFRQKKSNSSGNRTYSCCQQACSHTNFNKARGPGEAPGPFLFWE
ncbi:MAG TPA: hypothetical protein VFV38_19155 [Ktedonobacteraceae bacterium]|nr:hypothetical protein [Ktedonobacteraceae bacterium]